MAKKPAEPPTLYPIKNRWVHDAPYGIHVPGEDADVDELIASGAFSTDASDPDVDPDAPDLTVEPNLPEQIPGIPGGEPVPTPTDVEPEPDPTIDVPEGEPEPG